MDGSTIYPGSATTVAAVPGSGAVIVRERFTSLSVGLWSILIIAAADLSQMVLGSPSSHVTEVSALHLSG